MTSTSTSNSSIYKTTTSSYKLMTSPYTSSNHTNSSLIQGDRHICITTQEVSIVLNIITIIVGVVIVLVNFLVLLVSFKYPSKRFVALNWLICHLAFADLFIGVTIFYWYGIAEVLNVPVSSTEKVGFCGLSGVCIQASIQGLMMIALDRYLLILKQVKYSSYITKQRIFIIIPLMWIIPSVLQIVIPLSGSS
uniref:G-protein coupled receptors family 1 profile domain-containing protein n=1 Tax=Ciona intestinalis TaxID=7719 RepID=F6UZH2_CIOIN